MPLNDRPLWPFNHDNVYFQIFFSYKKQREEIQKVMNEAMKLTEEPEPTAFLEKSRTMISKGMNLKILKN